jgi:hypothetical protein
VLIETPHGPRLHRLVLRLPGLAVLTSPDHGPCDPFLPPSSLLAVASGHRDVRQGLRSLLQGLLGAARRSRRPTR